MMSAKTLEMLIEAAQRKKAEAEHEIEDLEDQLGDLTFQYRGERINGKEILERRDERQYRIKAASDLLSKIDSMTFPVSDPAFKVNRENMQILACAVSFDEEGQAFLRRWTKEMERLALGGGVGNKVIDRISPDDVRGMLVRAINVWKNECDAIEEIIDSEIFDDSPRRGPSL